MAHSFTNIRLQGRHSPDFSSPDGLAWQATDQNAVLTKEGWYMMFVGRVGYNGIRKSNTVRAQPMPFKTDEEARAWVARQAEQGSERHARAWKIHTRIKLEEG